MKTLALLLNKEPVTNYAELMDEYRLSKYGSKIVKLLVKENKHKHWKYNNNVILEVPGMYLLIDNYGYKNRNKYNDWVIVESFEVKDGRIIHKYDNSLIDGDKFS